MQSKCDIINMYKCSHLCTFIEKMISALLRCVTAALKVFKTVYTFIVHRAFALKIVQISLHAFSNMQVH